MLAAAGSAVGVGNLWRFPYLAAKDGGGLFLIVYLALVLTFGFTLLSSDIAIGRKTQKSAIGAYEEMQPKWKFLGILTFFNRGFMTIGNVFLSPYLPSLPFSYLTQSYCFFFFFSFLLFFFSSFNFFVFFIRLPLS